MKSIITALLLTATIASADYYDTQESKWHKTRRTLPQGRGQTSGLRNAPDSVLAANGIVPLVTDAAHEGMVAIDYGMPVVIDGIAHRVPITVTRAEYDAQQAAAAQAAAEAQAIADAADHEATAPSVNLSSWSKREQCLLLITFKLAKQHWPSMTKAQFLANVRAEWDAVK